MREVESGIKEEEVGLDERNNIYEGRIDKREKKSEIESHSLWGVLFLLWLLKSC